MNASPSKLEKLSVRWMIRRDMPHVLRIESQSFGAHAWQEQDFVNVLRRRHCIGIVVDLDDSAIDESKAAPVAFMLYELLPKRFDVLNFAVDPQWRRRGVATRMMTHMQKKCRFKTDRGLKGRTEIMLSVSEWNNGCIAFLRKLGFQGTGVQRDTIAMTDGTSCDSYGFRWTLPEVRQ